jgi:hypothetical protein
MNRIMGSQFYFGAIDRAEAERILEGSPNGRLLFVNLLNIKKYSDSYMIRDSSLSPHYLFTVSFRRMMRTFHLRVDQRSIIIHFSFEK